MVELREAMVEFERLVKEMDGYVGEDISLDTEALALTSLVHTDRQTSAWILRLWHSPHWYRQTGRHQPGVHRQND